MREKSQRQLRVGQEIRRLLSETMLRETLVDDANCDLSLTISEVELSPDLKHATVFVMSLGGQQGEDILDILIRHIPHYRTVIAKKMRTKYVPQLHFKIDGSFDEAERISTLLNTPKVRQDL